MFLTSYSAMSLGTFIQSMRLQHQMAGRDYSLRKMAARVGLSSAYLSKIEHGRGSPPTEKTLLALAADLKVDPNVMLAMGGRMSRELQAIVLARPLLMAELLEACQGLPDEEIVRLTNQAKSVQH